AVGRARLGLRPAVQQHDRADQRGEPQHREEDDQSSFSPQPSSASCPGCRLLIASSRILALALARHLTSSPAPPRGALLWAGGEPKPGHSLGKACAPAPPGSARAGHGVVTTGPAAEPDEARRDTTGRRV